MINFTKEEALLAAEQFCFVLETWTRQFTENRPTAEYLELDIPKPNEQYEYDQETKTRLQASVLYEAVNIIYNFAAHGVWEGKNEFSTEEMDEVSGEVQTYLEELCRFDEVFTKGENANAHLIFMGMFSTDCYFSVTINDKPILEILMKLTKALLARWKLIAPVGFAFSTEEISILSGLNVKTVRNALSSKGADRLVADEGGEINPGEAIRWLKRKKGFSGPFYIDEEIHYTRYEAIGQLAYHIDSLMKKKDKTFKDVSADLNLSDQDTEAFKALMKSQERSELSQVTPTFLKALGEYLEVSDLNVFVIEGSKIIGTTVAFAQASKLFEQK
jgi:hypothetical protein